MELGELGHHRLDGANAHFDRLLDHIIQALALERGKAVPEIGRRGLRGDSLDGLKRHRFLWVAGQPAVPGAVPAVEQDNVVAHNLSQDGGEVERLVLAKG